MLSARQEFTACMILIVNLLAGGPMACACGKYSALVGGHPSHIYRILLYIMLYVSNGDFVHIASVREFVTNGIIGYYAA